MYIYVHVCNKTALKVESPMLLCWLTMSEVDVGCNILLHFFYHLIEGIQMNWMILEVFSNLGDSMIL